MACRRRGMDVYDARPIVLMVAFRTSRLQTHATVCEVREDDNWEEQIGSLSVRHIPDTPALALCVSRFTYTVERNTTGRINFSRGGIRGTVPEGEADEVHILLILLLSVYDYEPSTVHCPRYNLQIQHTHLNRPPHARPAAAPKKSEPEAAPWWTHASRVSRKMATRTRRVV